MGKVCFIGHRQILDMSIREKLKKAVENEIKNGADFFTMGTHGDFDRMVLGVCRELRKTYKNITLVEIIQHIVIKMIVI